MSQAVAPRRGTCHALERSNERRDAIEQRRAFRGSRVFVKIGAVIPAPGGSLLCAVAAKNTCEEVTKDLREPNFGRVICVMERPIGQAAHFIRFGRQRVGFPTERVLSRKPARKLRVVCAPEAIHHRGGHQIGVEAHPVPPERPLENHVSFACF